MTLILDLLKVDSHRSTHDYLEFIYSYSVMPTIYNPARITESAAKVIDNILRNTENIKSSLLVTNISDHFPTTLSINIECMLLLLLRVVLQSGYISKNYIAVLF